MENCDFALEIIFLLIYKVISKFFCCNLWCIWYSILKILSHIHSIILSTAIKILVSKIILKNIQI